MVTPDTQLQTPADTATSWARWLAALPCVLDATQTRDMHCAFALVAAGQRQYACDVALLVAQLGLDAHAVMAALLHGLPRQAGFERAPLAARFGEDVVSLAAGVARVDALGGMRRAAAPDDASRAEALRKMLLAMARDIRVVCIALAMRVVDLRALPATATEHSR